MAVVAPGGPPAWTSGVDCHGFTCLSRTAPVLAAESHDASFVPQSQPVVYRADAPVNGLCRSAVRYKAAQVRKKYKTINWVTWSGMPLCVRLNDRQQNTRFYLR